MQISCSSELYHSVTSCGASKEALVVKKLCANVREDVRDTGSISGSGRSPGGGHGNPLQCSCLEHPTDRGAWQAVVHRVAQSQIQLKRLSMHAHGFIFYTPFLMNINFNCFPRFLLL
ncbi:unnamed protein product [Rangifer tarandus platyrhynchus]|uniref:Uncharacterized protein n=1 Tax=Rangifer tarandus platyrhynchus TaxID=3082113 RepID=A0ABN8Z0M1_RANTA|nr:unnamed protein product [Rangifer tarandus platyrhynchus]